MEAGPVPTAFARRSFVYRLLADLGAEFAEVNGAAVAMRFHRSVAEETAQAESLALVDLSALPRTGFKGNGAVEWLAQQGVLVGPDSNAAYRQTGGALALRLAPTEVFLIDDLAGEGRLIRQLERAWAWGEERPRRPVGYPMPRADSHCWFAVAGALSPVMFSKICGVDLRPAKFAPGRIAQTSAAKLSAIVVRDDRGRVPGYHLLADSASAEYLWGCVLDAMAEFGGTPVGLAALSRLGQS